MVALAGGAGEEVAGIAGTGAVALSTEAGIAATSTEVGAVADTGAGALSTEAGAAVTVAVVGAAAGGRTGAGFCEIHETHFFSFFFRPTIRK